jgi:hypothetical protein
MEKPIINNSFLPQSSGKIIIAGNNSWIIE